MQHLAFCPPGVPFFDLPGAGGVEEQDLPAASRPLDAGWHRSLGPDWVMVMPENVTLPVQGWKIHVSATLDNAERILDVTWSYALARRIPFKFVRSRQVLARRNGKYGDRSASGKFVTIYPADEAQLGSVLTELGTLLDGEPGPYILSDLRWRSGPLYVRYGGFVALTTRGEHGDVVHCIKDPQGRLVPDQRVPGFRPPPWAPLPELLQESLAARNAGTMQGFPYTVEKALHFSNGGGIYRGTDTRTGERVLLREARPLAGLDSNGDDAVARLEREHDMLRRLEGLPCVPALIDYRIGHEHYFLVREYVDGDPLALEINRRHPLCGEGPADGLAEYTRWATTTLDRIDEGLARLHGRGVFFGDLHPGNIMVRADGTVCFIDFETASTDPLHRQFQGAPGYVVPAGCLGPAADRYMMACLRIALFVPLSGMLSWGPHKADQLLEFVTTHFPVPPGFADTVRADLGAAHEEQYRQQDPAESRPFEARSPSALRDVADGILATATPQREDRLFPGDAAQFFTPEGGVAFAHGAAGVLWALAEVGADVPESCGDWLEQAARRSASATLGFYDGLSGIAFALDRLGRAEAAREVLDRVRERAGDHGGSDLFSGLAGVGLTELHFARRCGDGAPADRECVDRAATVAERVLDLAERAPGPRRVAPGLLRGRSGPALLLVRLYEQTRDAGYLDSAQRLLHDDLRALGWTPEGAWAPGAIGHRLGVGVGSGGTAMVVQDFLGHRPDPLLAAARDVVRQQAGRDLARSVGLLQGHAGAVLTALYLDDDPAPAVPAGRLEYLELLAARHGGHVAFLGYEGLRISADLLTGAAGAMLALDGLLTRRRAHLPFLDAGPARGERRPG